MSVLLPALLGLATPSPQFSVGSASSPAIAAALFDFDGTLAQSEDTRKKLTEKQRKARLLRKVRMPIIRDERKTQEELLREAAHTAVINRRRLQVMLRLEDDRRQHAGPPAAYSGPMITRRSRIGELSTLTFHHFDALPACINSVAKPPPPPPVCAVTGMKAKYRDPKTGKHYATLAAFKRIRAEAGIPFQPPEF